MNPNVISTEIPIHTIVITTRRDGNAKRPSPWKGRGGGKGHNKSPGKGKAQAASKQDGSKAKICLFVPFASHNASIHHAFNHTKEDFVQTVNLKSGEHANDARDALEKEAAHAPVDPVRSRATPMTVTMPVRPTQASEETDAAFKEREN